MQLCSNTHWRRIAVLFREVVVVGVSDIVLNVSGIYMLSVLSLVANFAGEGMSNG